MARTQTFAEFVLVFNICDWKVYIQTAYIESIGSICILVFSLCSIVGVLLSSLTLTNQSVNPFQLFLLSLVDRAASSTKRALRVGIVLSGGPAPGGHNVIAGVYDCIKSIHPESQLFGFMGGLDGVFQKKYRLVSDDLMDRFRNQGIRCRSSRSAFSSLLYLEYDKRIHIV